MMKPNDASHFGSECSDGLAPTVWARKDQIQQAITRGGLMCAMYPDTNQRADLQPLYDQAALDAAVAEANRRQNEAWKLMCEKMVAAERKRMAAKLELAEYLLGAFERGADASAYSRDIADFRA